MKALSITRKAIHREEHADDADSDENLSTNCRKTGEFDRTVACDKKALNIGKLEWWGEPR